MAHAYPVHQFRTADISADIDTLDDGTEASNSATIARFAAAGLVSSRIFDPGTANGPERAVPAVGAAAAGRGWRENPAINANEQVTTAAIGTWAPVLRVRRSGQALEVDQNSDTTVIAYRVDSAGVHQQEIGRSTQRFTWTTAAADRTFAFANPGAIVFAANDRIQLEVYVVTLTAVNVQAAPAVATDLIIQVGAAADSRFDGAGLDYTIQFRRTLSPVAVGVATLVRKLDLNRVLTVAAVGVVVIRRAIRIAAAKTATAIGVVSLTRKTKHILPTVAATGIVTLVRKTRKPLTATAAGVASLATRSQRFRTLTAVATGVVSMIRLGRFKRTLTATATGVPKGFVKIPFELLPGAADFSGSDPTFTIAGVVRDGSGNPVSGVTVRLMRESDHLMVEEKTSGGDGAYSFTRDSADPNTYYVVGHSPSDVTLHGTSRRELTPT